MMGGKFKAFVLVRDAQGRPKIDDPQNVPPEILAALTEEEKQEIFNGNYPHHDRSERTG